MWILFVILFVVFSPWVLVLSYRASLEREQHLRGQFQGLAKIRLGVIHRLVREQEESNPENNQGAGI